MPVVARRVTTFTVPPMLRPNSAFAFDDVTRNSCTESFTWNGIAWLLLEATLSAPSRRKLLEDGRLPEMLKVAPASGDPASTSCEFEVNSPNARKFRL